MTAITINKTTSTATIRAATIPIINTEPDDPGTTRKITRYNNLLVLSQSL